MVQGPGARAWPMISRPWSLLLLLALSAAAGCQSYTVRGRVIEGEISYVSIVSADEARLGEQGVGVPNVRVRLETDPERLRREIVGETVTDEEGYFSIPFARPGAGVLMYDIGVTAWKDGFTPATLTTRLPPSDRRMLIMLTPGPDDFRDPYKEDPMRQLDRMP